MDAPNLAQPPIQGSALNNPALPVSTAKSKYLLPLLALIFLIVGVGAGYFLGVRSKIPPTPITVQPSPTTSLPSPTPDETAGWKLYENIEKGYSVKYPTNVFVKVSCPSGVPTELNLLKRTNEKSETDEITVCGRSGQYDLETSTVDIATNLCEGCNPDNNYFTVTKEDIMVGGIQGRKYVIQKVRSDYQGPYEDWWEEVYVDYGRKIYRIYFEKKELQSVFNQILSTFRFANSGQTANWNTYTNSHYKFSLKYPSDWEFIENQLGGTKYTSLMISFAKKGNLPPPGTLPHLRVQITDTTDKTYFSLYSNTNYTDPTLIAGFPAEQRTHTSADLKEVVFTKDNSTYEIASEGYNQDPSLNSIFDQVLSTFRFL